MKITTYIIHRTLGGTTNRMGEAILYTIVLLNQLISPLAKDITYGRDVHALGLESGLIPDSSLTASSEWNADHSARRARLNLLRVNLLRGAWSAKENKLGEWIQVDLSVTYLIVGVAIQGRDDIDQWVTSFKVNCSLDGVSFDTVQDPNTNPASEKVFTGNSDRYTVVNNTLPVPQVCRYVRLVPQTWHEHISLRMEIYGLIPSGFQRSTVFRLISNAQILTDTHASYQSVTSLIRCGQLCLQDKSCNCFTYIHHNRACFLGQRSTTNARNGASTYVI
nr:retinoschisin-like [Lytechinus pictus]